MEQTLWHNVLGEIELLVPKASFEALFRETKLGRLNGSQVEIIVGNIFIEAQLERRWKKTILDILVKNGLKNPEVSFVIDSRKRDPVSREVTRLSEQTTPTSVASPLVHRAAQVTKRSSQSSTGLNPRYTFDSFIVGSSNDFAYSAAQAVTKDPGAKYNPLFLYSGVGLGKTHLMQAIGNEIVTTQPNLRVLYVTSETFIKEFLDAIRFKKDFSSKYRDVDVLIIDDMQFIAGKEKTQEEFFHTFNDLHQRNKQIIISSDRPPKDIPTLTERLRSRFEWGMTIDIQMPDFETRCAILDTKASASGVQLDQSTVQFLANSFRTNIRELEGALNNLLAYAEVRNVPPSLETAKGLLANVKATRPRHVTTRQVVIKTAAHFQISLEDIVSPKRSREIVIPRQVAMYLLRSELHLSFPKIASELNRKDHTTAIHAIEKIEKEIKLNPLIREDINTIRQVLYQ